jgi:fermentation-respiration switch protein FrsA (DUF1100 family)
MLFEDENLRTRDGETLHCWMIKQSGAAARQAPTFLVFHANAGNMGMRLPQLELMYKKLECNIFIISYRGYGESTGTPTEQGIEIDAETAMEHLLARTDIDRSLIFLHGTSLGGAVAVSILSKPKYGFKV